MSLPDDPERTLDTSLLDRLVDGELGEAERLAVLDRLERVPGGWRRCALAFLEAQAWRQALAQNGAEPAFGVTRSAAGAPVTPFRPAQEDGVAPGRRRRASARRLAVAAGLVAAFAAGWFSNAAGRPPRPAGEANTLAGPPVAQAAPLASAPNDDEQPAWSDIRPRPSAASLRREWERHGYRVEERQAVLAVELNDGRSVALPVDEVEYRFVGNRTY